jgi:lysophospholipase L1-like esterase
MFAVVFVSAAITTATPEAPLRFLRWEKEITAIEKRLAASPPMKGGVLFVGSSSIRLWDVTKAFPDSPVANVGFGGSEIRDCTFFVSRIVTPHQPNVIVFYAGDNDIANGRTAEQVATDFAAFTKAVHAKLPDCRILFLAVKPSLKRWKMYETQQRANAMVADQCKQNDRLKFVDVASVLLGPDGKPLPDYYVKDQLHLSAKGYERWVPVVGEYLPKKK